LIWRCVMLGEIKLRCPAFAASSQHAIRDFCSHWRYLRLKASSDRGERFVPFLLPPHLFRFCATWEESPVPQNRTDKSRIEERGIFTSTSTSSCHLPRISGQLSIDALRVLLGLAHTHLLLRDIKSPEAITTTSTTMTTNLLSLSLSLSLSRIPSPS
jgi:hypothetical protein